MEMHCASCKKNTANENSSVRKTKKNRFLLLPSCAVCGKEKSTFMKNKECHNYENILYDQFNH